MWRTVQRISRAVIEIVDPVDNAEYNEPLAEVCVVNVDRLINVDHET